MLLNQFQYLPLSGLSFLVLVAAFILIVILIQLGVLRYAYMHDLWNGDGPAAVASSA